MVLVALLSLAPTLGTPKALAAAPTAATAAPAQAQPVTLKVLLSAFSKMPGLQARFVERKHLKLLFKPLISKGVLYFTPPGYLARHVESPKPAKLLITPQNLQIRQDGQKKIIDLGARKDVKTFVESFARLLAGDHKALAATYVMKFTPAAKADGVWTLSLVPRSANLKKLIAGLKISGSGLAVRSIRVDETSGDYAVTEISSADPKRKFTSAERKQLFGIR